MKPLVTIGVISCNRLLYLRALLESAKRCIEYDNLDWIVIDNSSTEIGLQDYIRDLDYVNRKIFRKDRSPATEHLTAMNEIVEISKGEYIMLLPDDMQFIQKGNWLADIVEVIEENSSIGSVVLDAQRRETIRDNFLPRGFLRSGPKTFRAKSGREFFSYGKNKAGIVPAGIGAVTRKSVWEALGPWKATGDQIQGDSTGGGEDYMLNRYWHSGLRLERVLPRVPVAAGIFTPENNVQAYVRADRRYGNYYPPPDAPLYYEIYEGGSAEKFTQHTNPVSFEDIVIPVGFQHTYDKSGNFIKPKKNINDPSEQILKL